MAQRSGILTIYFLYFCLCFVKSYEHISCETNSDCQQGQFCYLYSHLCAPCTVCSRYNRAPSEWSQCPEEPLHCGACLDGFYEEILHRGEKRGLCLRSKPTKSSTGDAKNYSLRPFDNSIPSDENETLIFVNDETRGGSGTQILLIVLCTCAVVCMVGVSYIAMRHRHRRRRVEANCSHELNEFITTRESPPPYCPPDRAQLTPTDRDQPTIEISAPINDFMAVNVEAESLQKANPFRLPDYEGPEREETLNHNEPANNLDLNDEDTMPSFWTPNERSEVDNTSVRDNDSGIANESGSSDPAARSPTLYTGGVTRVEGVNLEGGSAAVSNINANTNQITLNITHYAFFNGDNNSNVPSRGNGGGSMTNTNDAVNTETGGGGALTGGSAICVAESAPQYVPFRP